MLIKLWLVLLVLIPYSLFCIELSTDEKVYLEKLGTIKVCVDPDWEPFEMMDKKGNYTGIGADLLRLVSKRIGLSVEIVPTKDWDESVAYSKAGKCQIISFLNQSPYRDTWLLFTKPHFSDPNVFITREEHPFIGDPRDLIHESIVFPVGTAMEEFVRSEYPNLKIMTTASETDAFKFVSEKKADITMRSLIVAAYTLKKEGMFNLKIAGQLPDYTNQLRIGVIKSEPMLRDILNKGVDTISAEDRASIVNKYVSIKAQTAYDYDLILKVFFVFLMVGLLLLWRYYKLRKYNKELLYLSETDILTKIYNRTKIEKELVTHVEHAKQMKKNFSILLIDLDFFKVVNDTFGHPVGDQVLIEMAQLIKESIRHDDLLGRWGGEEFLILCPNSTREDAYKVAERIQEKLKSAVFSTQQRQSVSIGGESMNLDDTSYTLISRADMALYKAKNAGRDTICFFE
ncbi:diguanylate cyclase [Sulfurospirillum sp.]|uniref:diguanylate cyclase n=1 Tax=Sulfurospirillum sp. TaxID=2053622 RepID=UPI002FDC8313